MLTKNTVNMLRGPVVILLLACYSALLMAANDSDLTAQRSLFLDAEQSLNSNQINRYRELLAALENYPLYPYLKYQELRRKLPTTHAEEITAFANQFANTPLAAKLSRQWLISQATHRRWEAFLDHYQPNNDTELKCYYVRAVYHTADKTTALTLVEPLWLVGRSQPKACDPLFSTWQDAGYLTSELAWQRFQLAIENGQYQLARYLLRFIEGDQRSWADLWLTLKRHPEKILSEKRLNIDQPLQRTIASYAVKRLARFNAQQADETWHAIKAHYQFSEKQINSIERRLALSALLQKREVEKFTVSHLLDNPLNQDLQEWRIRTAIAVGDWEAVLIWLERLSEVASRSLRWQYWYARALNELTESPTQEAQNIYQQLAEKRNYYGFLAADHLNLPYQLSHNKIQFEQFQLTNISQIPGIQRAKELFLLGRVVDARREWLMATRGMDNEQLAQAAQLADNWEWHDRAILTIASTPYRDDLELRFPLAYKGYVEQEAKKQAVDPSWIMAVIRQESAFMADARSPKGALGLMQLMPKTGREIGRLLREPVANNANLLQSDLNIRFGIKELQRNLHRFQDQLVPATAAYNAGYGRVRSWLPEERNIAADQWVESITFKETRHYVQNILAYKVIYEQRMGLSTTPLKQIMTPITPKPGS